METTEKEKQIFILPFKSMYEAHEYLQISPIRFSIITSFGLLSKKHKQILSGQNFHRHIIKGGVLTDLGDKPIDEKKFEEIVEEIFQELQNKSVMIFVEDEYKEKFYKFFNKIVNTQILECWGEGKKGEGDEIKPFVITFHNIFKPYWDTEENEMKNLLFLKKDRVN